MKSPQEAAEATALSAVRRRFTMESGYEVVDGADPLEVRDRRTGETFMLEVRALPMGG